ncbi:MAG: hypothetical protein HZB23_05950 [Deltaproteobacteria bacterium]|nr:hypothetical protein [Deltaproteobacteria bacterium]
MEDKRNLLVGSMPSAFFFVVFFSALFVVTFLVARGLASVAEIDNIVSIRFILMYVTLYGLLTGVILAAFQKRVGLIAVGAISGAVGSWINWAAAAMLCIWMVCYGAILTVVSLVKQDSPVWTMMNAKTEMVEALAKYPMLIFGAAFVVGVLFLIAYARIKFDAVYPAWASIRLTVAVMVGVAVIVGVVLALLAPRVTQKQFISASFATLPDRVNMAAVQGVNASIGVRLMKFAGMEEAGKSDFAMPGQEAPEAKKLPDIFFADYTINIEDGAVSVVPGLGPKTQANVAVYLDHWMQIARGEHTIGSVLDISMASFTGSEEVLRATDPYFKAYQPPLHQAFTDIVIIAVILLLGSFSIAPMLCVYDAFHYWSQEWASEAV